MYWRNSANSDEHDERAGSRKVSCIPIRIMRIVRWMCRSSHRRVNYSDCLPMVAITSTALRIFAGKRNVICAALPIFHPSIATTPSSARPPKTAPCHATKHCAENHRCSILVARRLSAVPTTLSHLDSLQADKHHRRRNTTIRQTASAIRSKRR